TYHRGSLVKTSNHLSVHTPPKAEPKTARRQINRDVSECSLQKKSVDVNRVTDSFRRQGKKYASGTEMTEAEVERSSRHPKLSGSAELGIRLDNRSATENPVSLGLEIPPDKP
ncbi:hypothetical protein BaRGS_00038179, partial [Batillaria attramentaria]